MNIKYTLPFIAILPTLFFSFKPADIRQKSEKIFQDTKVMTTAYHKNGEDEGSFVYTEFSKRSENLESEVSTRRTRESTIIIARTLMEYEHSVAIIAMNDN